MFAEGHSSQLDEGQTNRKWGEEQPAHERSSYGAVQYRAWRTRGINYRRLDTWTPGHEGRGKCTEGGSQHESRVLGALAEMAQLLCLPRFAGDETEWGRERWMGKCEMESFGRVGCQGAAIKMHPGKKRGLPQQPWIWPGAKKVLVQVRWVQLEHGQTGRRLQLRRGASQGTEKLGSFLRVELVVWCAGRRGLAWAA